MKKVWYFSSVFPYIYSKFDDRPWVRIPPSLDKLKKDWEKEYNKRIKNV